ncbi:ABC transporter permease [Paraburkholderia sp. CNPSo 3272]|uniref:ABC transporter permease n=1 Tax=Paraburkholderia sp. CNPSo 3272 TaxID=2940931 RepID=UPI0020B6E0E2|nr:ABC transporter permease [Paraburkholderia sp. CNPSo 3272]MCP3724538.1 ABC transporter permease [Paraburkholderia sp. CNPSo 3272]
MSRSNDHAMAIASGTEQRRLHAWLTNVKYYAGLLVLLAFGALTSPHTPDGSNIFLSAANISDVFRQVANVGVISVGMTLVIITAGIDLSVGSIMGLGSVLTAILLTTPGSNAASWSTLALDAASVFALVFFACAAMSRRRHRQTARAALNGGAAVAGAGAPRTAVHAAIAVVCALAACAYAYVQLPQKVSLLSVMWMVPLAGLAIGAVNGWVITRGRMQPFIVTLAAMVGVLGLARLIAGQDTAVYSIYSGTNATTDIESLRALLFGIVPVPALFFLVIALIADFLLNRTVFGKYLYAIGGNEKCAVVSGLKVDRHKIAAYAISGMLAALVGVLYAAQYRQGKADAGVGWELDAIAAVVIGGTSLMGGVGRIAGTVVGVLIFGFLGNILLLNNIDSNTQLVLKGFIIVVAVFLQQTKLRPQALLTHLRGRRARSTH